MFKIFFFLILFATNFRGFSQKFVTISGKITGIQNSTIYLSNKSFSFGHKYILFDSVLSKDGTFQFTDFKFRETDFYSIQSKGSSEWLPFLIDTGHIYIVANKGFLSLGKVIGSAENDLFRSYSKNIIGPYFTENRLDFDSVNKYRGLDSSLFIYYSNLLKKVEAKLLLNQEKFIEQHPTSYVSLIILNEIQSQIPIETLVFYFKQMSSELQHHSKAIELRKRVQQFL